MKRPRRSLWRTLAFVAGVAAFALIGWQMVGGAPFDQNRPRVGEQARAFEIQGFNLADFKGKKNVVMIFYRGHF